MTDIEVRHLTKKFGALTAVDDVSFTAPGGSVTGFLGPNASGKTTTFRMLLSLIRPSAGEALIGGIRYGELSRPRHQVGAVLESPLVPAIRSEFGKIATIRSPALLLAAATLRWLPFTASEALDQTNISAPGSLLPQWGGGLVLLGYAAVFAAAAMLVTLGRDVT